jgi:hypothetical protein
MAIGMKQIIIIFCLVLLVDCAFSQEKNPLRDAFDQRLEPIYSGIDYKNPATYWWQGWGFTLMAYLRMYEATDDVQYLDKFIKHTQGIIKAKGDNAIWNEQMQNHNGTIVLYTGQLLRPMAEFVYLVNQKNELGNVELKSNDLQSNVNGKPLRNYQDFASFLELKVQKSLDYMNETYWVNDTRCYGKNKITKFQRNCTDNNCKGFACIFNDCPSPIEINFNASYAAAMFYLGAVDTLKYADYTHKATQICAYFKVRITEYKPNQSFTWFHDNHNDCFAPGIPCREDVSHGAIDIQIPLVAFQVHGDKIFSEIEMQKFANTFTQNIWDRGKQIFQNNVFGISGEMTPDTICNQIVNNNSPNFYALGEVLAWIPIHVFDQSTDVSNSVFEVLYQQTVRLLNNDPLALKPKGYCRNYTANLSGSQSFYGLSEVIKAQIFREKIIREK